MGVEFIKIGFGNVVSANRIVAICSPESAPVKRLVQEARQNGRLIDATYGRRTRSVIFTDSDHIILATIQSGTVLNRQQSEKQSRREPPATQNKAAKDKHRKKTEE